MKGILEGLLFVVGEDGLDMGQIKEILEIDDNEALNLIKDLKNDYIDSDRGLRIDILGNKFKLTTKYEHRDYYKKLTTNSENNKLSQASLETLAIIAYNEPITRVEIDEIRGVSTSHIIRKLVARGLIKEVGRSDTLRGAILYKTTSLFLDYFGLSSIDDLPSIESLKKEEDIDIETDLYKSKYIEEEVVSDEV